MYPMDFSVSNDTLVTIALILGIAVLAVLLVRWLLGRPWGRD